MSAKVCCVIMCTTLSCILNLWIGKKKLYGCGSTEVLNSVVGALEICWDGCEGTGWICQGKGVFIVSTLFFY